MTTTYELYTNENGTPKAVEGKAPAILERVEALEGTLDNGVVTSINGNTGEVAPEQTGCLPLSGGTMTGDIVFGTDAMVIRKPTSDKYLAFRGGDGYSTGASLVLYGKNASDTPGAARLIAHNGTNNYSFYCYPDGRMTWVGKEVERVNSSGKTDSGIWIRYESGLQICTVDAKYTASAENVSVSLPVAFTGGVWCSLTNYSAVPMAGIWSYKIINSQTIQVSVYHTGNKTDYLTYDAVPTLICVGFWK